MNTLLSIVYFVLMTFCAVLALACVSVGAYSATNLSMAGMFVFLGLSVYRSCQATAE